MVSGSHIFALLRSSDALIGTLPRRLGIGPSTALIVSFVKQRDLSISKSSRSFPVNKTHEAAYVSGVKKHFPGPVFAPADLDRYCVGASNGKSNSNVLSPCEGSARDSNLR
jgi:hypothetical protein